MNRVKHGHAHPLPKGKPLQVHLSSGESLRSLQLRDRFAGVLVLQSGRVRLVRFALHATSSTAWTCFSVTKSVTATLVGYALRDGSIHDADDEVTRYIPELRGSAYDGVTVRQLAGMTSGIHWIEDYQAPNSDNVKLYATPVTTGRDQVVEYMRRLPREAEPGTKFVYKTGETDLLGVLVRRAVHMPLSQYLERTLWREIGARSNAFWIADRGKEFGGSGLSATLEDFGRFGEFVRLHREAVAQDKAFARDEPSKPATRNRLDDWLSAATRPAGDDGKYGLGWWTYADGSFAALGIFGQSILVDPSRDLVVVTLGAWPNPTSPELVRDREALWTAVKQAVDASSLAHSH